MSSLHVGGAGRLLLRNIQYMNRGRFENHVCYFVPRRELEPNIVRLDSSLSTWITAADHMDRARSLVSFDSSGIRQLISFIRT
jgi:hypothetical protein